MIKMKEYYSDVYTGSDDHFITCHKCNNEFLTGEILLNIPDDEDYTEDDIIECCPFCKEQI